MLHPQETGVPYPESGPIFVPFRVSRVSGSRLGWFYLRGNVTNDIFGCYIVIYAHRGASSGSKPG